MTVGAETNPAVLAHYERLFQRNPALEGNRDEIMNAYLMLRDCYAQGGKVMIAGNGGSCADSEHIVGELMKGFLLRRPLPEDVKARIRENTAELLPGAADLFQQGLPAIALTGHNALSTAVVNDLDPVMAIAQQVVGYGRPGDVFIGISTSGNAKNIALAASTAKALGVRTLGLTGGTGGRLKALCDAAIVVPGNQPADVQELHLPVYHALCAMLEARFFSE
ncbi:MAG: SIS domain-containing protein [Clostridia bacterium]|nr:SIS domain-containing protein [Clostridia bacterium]